MHTVEIKETYTAKAHYDIIVAGGGVAGIAAALTAAKTGKRVLLLEKSMILGGLATLGHIHFFVPMCNGRGKQIIFGLADKLLQESRKYSYDTVASEWKNGEPKEPTNVRYCNVYSANIFALQLTDLIVDAGVSLLFDCVAALPVMEGNFCRGVLIEGKAGREYYTADVVIDTTGDCDLLRRAGVPTAAGGNFFTYMCSQITLDGCKKAVETGDIHYAYDRAMSNLRGGAIDLYGYGQPADVPLYSGLSPEEVSDYLIRNQRLVLEKMKQTDRLSRDITHLPHMAQFRTTCRMIGDYSLRASDVYTHFEDSVAAINDFDHRDALYEVPYRCLYNSNFPNLLTAGRCASGEGWGWDVLRVIPPAILTGQAAGEAASLAIEDKCAVAAVDIKKLQARLERDDMLLHFPDEYIPADRNAFDFAPGEGHM